MDDPLVWLLKEFNSGSKVVLEVPFAGSSLLARVIKGKYSIGDHVLDKNPPRMPLESECECLSFFL